MKEIQVKDATGCFVSQHSLSFLIALKQDLSSKHPCITSAMDLKLCKHCHFVTRQEVLIPITWLVSYVLAGQSGHPCGTLM